MLAKLIEMVMARDKNPGEIADALHSAAIHLLRRLRKADAEAGMTGAPSSVLSVLVFGGPSSLSALAAAEHVRPPTMSRLISDMEALGWVTREISPADARAVRINATEKGRAVFDTARTLRLRRLADAVGGRTPEEQAILARAAAMIAEIAGRA